MSRVIRSLGCAFLAVFSVGAISADEIKNWSAPPYWGGLARAHAPGEPALAEAEEPALEPMGGLPTSPLPFTGITPCRIVDTRGPTGSFGGPALAANATRTFNIPSGPCPGIPTDAGAYSLNFTIIGGSGVFTNAFLTAWPTGTAQPVVSTLNFNANQLEANAAVVPAGTSGSINVFVNAPGNLLVDINGYYRIDPVNTFLGMSAGNLMMTGLFNVGVGAEALSSNPTGHRNTAIGTFAMSNGSTGSTNTAVGYSALDNNTGDDNCAFGAESLGFNAGNDNTAIGTSSLRGNVSGSNNTAVGSGSLDVNNSGGSNVAVGVAALGGNTSGSNNIAIGVGAGNLLTTGNNNIYIGNLGSTGAETGQIRIGTVASITSGTVIVGISGFQSVGGIPVIVNGGGRMGTTTSSIRFKEDVHDLGAASSDLMKLRPVAFRYKESTLQEYGLIAEEVAEVYPELVVNDDQGRPLAIRSQLLEPLFLNELQNQRRTIEQQSAEIANLRARLAEFEKRLASFTH